MFLLTKNTFLEDGICRYKDECGNTAFFKRTGDVSFVGKIRFIDKDVTAQPLYISLPFDEDEKGTYLHIDYANGEKESTTVSVGIDGYTELMQRWIKMLADIRTFSTDNGLYRKIPGQENISDEDIYMHKMGFIAEYEELKPTIESIFGERNN